MESYNDVYLNFIHGQWKPGSSGSWETKRNPSRPVETLGKATRSTAVDVTRAVDAAVAAQPAWARRSRPSRGAILQHAAQVIKHKAENYAKTLARETGRELKDARAEVQKAIAALDLAANETRRPSGSALPVEATQSLSLTARQPRGTVAVVSPWSQPLLTPARQLAAALAEGNAVVFKPSSQAPAISTLLVRAFEEASLPVGALNLVFGPGAVVGRALVEEPRVAAIAFAGSPEVGRELAGLAAKRLAPIELELGGRGCAIICADANLDLACEEIARSAFGSAGSRAGAVARVWVAAPLHDAFVQRVATLARAYKTGEGAAPALAPLIDDRRTQAALAWVETATQGGSTLVCGGSRALGAGAPSGVAGELAGNFLAPTVLAEAASPPPGPGVTAAATTGEGLSSLIGPILSVRTLASLEEARDALAAAPRTVALSIFTRDPARFLTEAAQWNTRQLQVNCADTELREADSGSALHFTPQTVVLASQ